MDYTLSCPPYFMGKENTSYAQANVIIFLVPYDGTVCFTAGTHKGPEAIIRASSMVEWWDEELFWEPTEKLKFNTTAPFEPKPDESPESYLSRLESQVHAIYKKEAFFLTLGGEHSITAPIVRSLSTQQAKLTGDLPAQITIVQIDAHSDLFDEFQGTPYSHACVMRRLAEYGVSIIQIGIRGIERREYEFAQRNDNISMYYAHLLQNPSQLEQLIEHLRSLSGHVYFSLDIDGLDTAIAPGTGTPQPGGLGWYPTLRILRAVFMESSADVIGADIVEVIPLPGMPITEFTAAKLAYKMLSYAFYEKLTAR